MQSFIRKGLLIGAFAIAGVVTVGLGLEITDGNDGIASAQTAATPSVFVPIDSYRAYDSRWGVNPAGRMEVSETVTITADEDIEGNQIIPDDATAVTFNITAADTRGAGHLQVTTANRELGNTSTINWSDDFQVVANSGVTALFEAGDVNATLENTFAIFIDGRPGSSTHVVIDITGYYVAA